jgi:hypothetical protein
MKAKMVPDSNTQMSTDRMHPLIVKVIAPDSSVPSEDDAAATQKIGSLKFYLPSTMSPINRMHRGSMQWSNMKPAPHTAKTVEPMANKLQPAAAIHPVLTLSEHPLDTFVATIF